jgi:hypothetical protein
MAFPFVGDLAATLQIISPRWRTIKLIGQSLGPAEAAAANETDFFLHRISPTESGRRRPQRASENEKNKKRSLPTAAIALAGSGLFVKSAT